MPHKIIDGKDFAKEIERMKLKNKEAAKKICKELSERGLKKMQEIYDSYELTGSVPSTIYMEGTDTEKRIIMQGPQAIYDEFGTGTMGERSPHPIKGDFALNDYNSGRTIRHATGFDMDNALMQGKHIPIGGLFWTYKDASGQKIYTQGTPAQREAFDSKMYVKEKSPEVIRKIMKEVLNG